MKKGVAVTGESWSYAQRALGSAAQLKMTPAVSFGLAVLFALTARTLDHLMPGISVGSLYGPFGNFSGSLTRAGNATVIVAAVGWLFSRAGEQTRRISRALTLIGAFAFFSGMQEHFLILTALPLAYFALSLLVDRAPHWARIGFVLVPLVVGLADIALFASGRANQGTWRELQPYLRGTGTFAHLFLWSIDRFVYKDKRARDFFLFTDYFFHPLFLIVTSQLYMIPFSKFAGMRSPEHVRLSDYGLIYGKAGLLVLFYPHLQPRVWNPAAESMLSWAFWNGPWVWTSIYAEHVGFGSAQILCGAGAGYWIPIDTRYPFLSRSFFEHFNRLHTYVRDCVIHAFVMPLQLWLRRRTVGKNAAYVISGTIGYLWIMFQRTGPLPMRTTIPWTVAPIFTVIFLVFGLLPTLYGQTGERIARQSRESGRELIRGLPYWGFRDIAGWLGNYLIYVASRILPALIHL